MDESKRKRKRTAKKREKFEVGDDEVETRGGEEAKQGNKKRNIDDLENEKTKYKEKKEKRKKNTYRAGNNVEKISEERQKNKDEKKEKKEKKKGKDKLIHAGNNMEENSEIEDKKKRKKKEKYSEETTEIISDKSQEIEEDYQEKKRKRKKKREDENVENQETENKKKKMENDNEDLEIFVDKTKKKKSKKSKSEEEAVLSFINNMKEGFKNVSVDENGDLDDDTTSVFQQKNEEKIRKEDKNPYSSKNEAPGDDKATLKTKKKEKRKRTEIKSAESENSDASDKKNSGDEALLYLKMWKEDRANWAFKKVRQVWLLKHMFDKSKVPDNDFEVLLLYLEGLQGMARKTTISRAEALLDSGDDEQKSEEFDLERVKQLLQILNYSAAWRSFNMIARGF